MPEISRGHAFRRILAGYALEDLRGRRASLILDVESKIRLSLSGVRAVAGIAFVGENRPNVSIEVDRERGKRE